MYLISFCFVSPASRTRLGFFKGEDFRISPWKNPKILTLKKNLLRVAEGDEQNIEKLLQSVFKGIKC